MSKKDIIGVLVLALMVGGCFLIVKYFSKDLENDYREASFDCFMMKLNYDHRSPEYQKFDSLEKRYKYLSDSVALAKHGIK